MSRESTWAVPNPAGYVAWQYPLHDYNPPSPLLVLYTMDSHVKPRLRRERRPGKGDGAGDLSSGCAGGQLRDSSRVWIRGLDPGPDHLAGHFRLHHHFHLPAGEGRRHEHDAVAPGSGTD